MESARISGLQGLEQGKERKRAEFPGKKRMEEEQERKGTRSHKNPVLSAENWGDDRKLYLYWLSLTKLQAAAVEGR